MSEEAGEGTGPPGGAAAARQLAEREALLRIAAATATATDLESVIELVAEEARGAIGASSLAINRFERERTLYRTLINVGELTEWEERRPAEEVYDVADYAGLREMARSGRPYFTSVDDPEGDPADIDFLRGLGKTSDLSTAIAVEGEVWGGIWATRADGTNFRSEDVRFLEAVGGQLAGVIGRAELFSRVSRLAYEDPLTGLANRRAFEERLARAMRRFATGRSGVAIVLSDLDGLKAINDSRGHLAGDEALRAAGGSLVAAAAEHPGAFVARLAGDEFCVLLEQRAGGDGLAAAERLATTAQRLLTEDGSGSISCGVAAASERIATAKELLSAADNAQYVAKRRGGGRVCSAAKVPEARGHQGSGEADVAQRLAAAAEAVAAGLADGLAGASVLDRLEFVSATFADATGLARWAVSLAASGTSYLRELSFADNRDGHRTGARIAPGDEREALYDLDDYPLTAAIVDRGAGSFVVRGDDREADAAERALLERERVEGVVAAVVADEDGAYLVELISDDPLAPLEAIEPLLALATRAAMNVVPHQRAADPAASANSRALELSLALADRLAGATAEHQVSEASVDEVQRALGCSVVHLVGIAGDRFELRAERGPKRTTPGWSQPVDVGLIGRALRERGPVLAVDVSREPGYRWTEATREVRSELAVPVMVAGEPWGVINLEDTEVGAFNLDDARLLESVAAQIGGALGAIRLYEQLDRAYLGTAEALSAALEEKDSYTAAHSQSIAAHAVAVGRRLGMGVEELRMLRYAAAFHDIGKLAIPQEVLNKEGPLSAEEWEAVSQHTVIGERILRPIEFLAPIRPVVRAAHERWDGGGYPDGLAGEEIPLGARILFACDAYDAMTTDRSYRGALPEREALAELRRNAGSQFDPGVVHVLAEVIEAELAPEGEERGAEPAAAGARDRAPGEPAGAPAARDAIAG